MADHMELWRELAKLPDGDKDPFETPLGPTDQCLSANQTVHFVQSGETDTDTLQHLESCEACRERLDRFKAVYSG